MITAKNQNPRNELLNEIVSTLEFIDFLKYESKEPVKKILENEERKKEKLIARYKREVN